MTDIERCDVPPEGWWCSREKGHDGPCAAREVEPMSWEDLATRLQVEKIALHDQLRGVVEALRKLADLHHRTLVNSKLHDPENRDWTECECKSCRLAQPFGGQ
jgi:hypothetical protein